MKTFRRLSMAAASVALLSSAPAAASDFDEVVYLLMGGAALVLLLAVATVLGLRKLVYSHGAKADALAALAIAAIIAPSMVHENEYGLHFTLLPHWVALFGGGWPEYLPWPFLSFFATTGLIYLVFARLRRKAAAREAGSAE